MNCSKKICIRLSDVLMKLNISIRLVKNINSKKDRILLRE